MQTPILISALATILHFITCEDQCGEPHKVDRATISDPSDSGYVLGSTVTYKCDYGFITGGTVKTSKCIKDSETEEHVWTRPEITCNPRSCEDPGFVNNARRSGSRFTFPNSVEYICNEGYRLRGTPKRYCEASGVWSGRLPTCVVVRCSKPSDPENGRAVYTSLEYDSELRYECNAGLELSSDQLRTCGSDGEWTGAKPVCKEIECAPPAKPDFGTMEVIGNKAKIGSIVIYKCDEGRRLIGSSNSKCIKNNGTGEWMFPAPKCVEPCKTPDVSDGQVGKYQRERKWNGWVTVFKKVYAGTILEENENVILKCNRGYVVDGQKASEVTITCLGGELLPEPKCITTTCNDDPPSILNGRAMINSRQNGHVIWYQCNRGFEKVKTGHIMCDYGRWTGTPPECGGNRCDTESLNYPGLVREKGILNDGDSFEPKCMDGYKVTESSYRNILCSNGEWTGNLPPCTLARCRTESLLSYSGIILQGHRSLDDGEWIQPMCAEGFEFGNKNDSKLYCRAGNWTGNVPPCTPAHCFNDPPVPENGRIKSMYAKGHGSAVEYECFPFYKLQGTNSVICAYGKWSGSSPSCTDSRCYLRNLVQKDGVDLINDEPIYSGQIAPISCIKGYSLKYPRVLCVDGEWQPENLLSPCQEDPCKVKPIRNGELLEKKYESIKNWLGREIGVRTVSEAATMGASKISGESLYVKCNDQYSFQGEENQEPGEVTCRRGRWMPFPVCLLPGEQTSTEISETKLDSHLPVTPLFDSSLINPAVKEDSKNITLEDDVEEISLLDVTSTENGGQSLSTDVPTCSCKYNVDDDNLKGYNGDKIFKLGDDIPSGTVVEFYCTRLGVYRLRGPASVTCPADCNWHSSLFPSCVSPNDDDVVIGIHSQPAENVKVGIGGVVTVIPGTDVTLGCRASTGQRIFVDWISPQTSTGTTQLVQSTSTGVNTVYYYLREVTERDSGRYTCVRSNGVTRHIEVKVAAVHCGKLEDSGDMVVSYSDNNRPFKSTAYFHCFSPSKREGPSSVTCEASGLWSAPPPTCQPPTCSIGSLYDIIPEGVVPHLEEGTSENVPYGHVLKLICDENGRVIKGSNTATCSTDGKWKTEAKVECVQGCAGFIKKDDSQLLITPEKEYYAMGELVTFSCPADKTLSQDVERILCFGSGWTPSSNVPDCQ